MRDPFSWSFPVGRLFGIAIRIHILFPVVALGLTMKMVVEYKIPLADVLWVNLLFVVSVLLHEFGHCFAGRWVGGEANEVLLWPLGGLATVQVPHTPRANLLMVLGGPVVNLLLCLGSLLALALAFDTAWRPSFNPFWNPFGSPVPVWGGGEPGTESFLVLLLARLFWVNWVLFLLNMVLVGFPLDAGRILQCLLWPSKGFHQATMVAVMAGFITMLLLIVIALVKESVGLACLAFFIYQSCKQQWILLETGGEESLFGYDFSQGYTSLEKDSAPPTPKKKQPNFFQRWRQRRAAQKMLREQQCQEEEERRMDQLLEKIAQHGKDSLTDEEHHFLKKVSDRYRNRH